MHQAVEHLFTYTIHIFAFISDEAVSSVSRIQTNHPTGKVMSNIEPSVVEDQHKWSMFKSSVNLPAVLNDPRLLKRETDFFTKTWGVDFYERSSISPSHLLPEINRAHFEQYIRKTSTVSIFLHRAPIETSSLM